MGDHLDQSFPSRQVSQRNPTRQVFEHLSLTLLLYKMMDIQEHLWCICRLLLGVQYVYACHKISNFTGRHIQCLEFSMKKFKEVNGIWRVYSSFREKTILILKKCGQSWFLL